MSQHSWQHISRRYRRSRVCWSEQIRRECGGLDPSTSSCLATTPLLVSVFSQPLLIWVSALTSTLRTNVFGFKGTASPQHGKAPSILIKLRWGRARSKSGCFWELCSPESRPPRCTQRPSECQNASFVSFYLPHSANSISFHKAILGISLLFLVLMLTFGCWSLSAKLLWRPNTALSMLVMRKLKRGLQSQLCVASCPQWSYGKVEKSLYCPILMSKMSLQRLFLH